MEVGGVTVRVTSWEEARRAATAVRREVFVEEQKIAEELETDEVNDARCWHAVAEMGGVPVGTARLFADGKVGRMAVVSKCRKTGLEKSMLLALIDKAKREGLKELHCEAQTSAEAFWTKSGFVRTGEPYMNKEVNIEHVDMILRL